MKRSEAGSSARSAYEAFAPAYDAFTSRNDYELWLAKLLPILERFGVRGPGRLLDVGCGTGNSFLPMVSRGWTVTGCDISPAMLAIARAKTSGVRLCAADMRELPLLGAFDLVWAIDDAINYLLEVADVEKALERMAANLAEDGLIVFDVNSLGTYRRAFATREVSERGGCRVLWEGRSRRDVAAGSICEARLEGDGIAPHVHRQRHYGVGEIERAIEAAGLRCVDRFGFDDSVNLSRPPDEIRDSKIAFVASRAESREVSVSPGAGGPTA